jgi:hypothetical protein
MIGYQNRMVLRIDDSILHQAGTSEFQLCNCFESQLCQSFDSVIEGYGDGRGLAVAMGVVFGE